MTRLDTEACHKPAEFDIPSLKSNVWLRLEPGLDKLLHYKNEFDNNHKWTRNGAKGLAGRLTGSCGRNGSAQ